MSDVLTVRCTQMEHQDVVGNSYQMLVTSNVIAQLIYLPLLTLPP